jgi:nitrite reductase/ring-hydroxylating ferredoxin subunit
LEELNMLRKSIMLGVLLVLSFIILAVSACSSRAEGAGNANSVTAKQTAIKAVSINDLVSVPLSDVEKYTNTRFQVNTGSTPLTFMAYQYAGKTYVRADICPPCRSESFTLTNGTLVCDRCGTVFNAGTGAGIKGACVQFAKQSVPFEIKDGNMLMKANDLTAAYQNTLNPKR